MSSASCLPNYRIHSIRPFPKKSNTIKRRRRKKRVRKSSYSKNDRNLNFTRERSSLEKHSLWITRRSPPNSSSLCSLFSCAEAAGNSEVPLETVPSQHDRAILDRGSVTEAEIRRGGGGGRFVFRSYCQCHDPVSVAALLPPPTPSDPESIPETIVLRHLGRSANP